jgi:hypothetical protein
VALRPTLSDGLPFSGSLIGKQNKYVQKKCQKEINFLMINYAF